MIKKRKKIGIVGGIGPEATGNFYLNLIKKFQKDWLINSNKDYPKIVINSIPAPELIQKNVSNRNLIPYVLGLKELEKFGVDFIVMVCNTIYLFYNRLRKEVKIPIIDLEEEVKDFLTKRNIKSITVLGTQAVIKRGLYKFKNIDSIDLTDREMEILANAIFNFNKGKEKEKQIEIVKNIAKRYLNQGSEFLLLGCTELDLMLKKENIPKISPVDILIKATIQRLLE